MFHLTRCIRTFHLAEGVTFCPMGFDRFSICLNGIRGKTDPQLPLTSLARRIVFGNASRCNSRLSSRLFTSGNICSIDRSLTLPTVKDPLPSSLDLAYLKRSPEVRATIGDKIRAMDSIKTGGNCKREPIPGQMQYLTADTFDRAVLTRRLRIMSQSPHRAHPRGLG